MIFPKTKRAFKVKWKTFFLAWQVLLFKLKKQTSKNVADTTNVIYGGLKMLETIITEVTFTEFSIWVFFLEQSRFTTSTTSTVSQTLRYYPVEYHRDLTSTYSYRLDSKQEPWISKCKLLNTKLYGKEPWVPWKLEI